MNTWHILDTEKVLQELRTNPETGLSAQEASERLKIHGPNELREAGGKSIPRLILDQLKSVMVLILIAAAILSFALKDPADGIAILAIVVLYVILGFSQEYRAEKAIAALKKLSIPFVRVLRSGQVQEIPASHLVPGEMIFLETGGIVPADCRLIEAVNLRIQESALTGESEPVEKVNRPLDREDIPIGDRINLAFMGSSVTAGRGTAVVISTGMQTELGKIAGLIQSTPETTTPLQKKLDQLGKRLAMVAGVVSVLVILLGLLRGEALKDMLMTGVSLLVAVIPEGLPAVVTITLALGSQRMLKRNALIRSLPSVETLGSVTVICSDKTGTLTENRMTVTVLDVAGHQLNLSEAIEHRKPVMLPDQVSQAEGMSHPGIALLLAGAALCNDSQLVTDPETGQTRALGDPTEGALVIAAAMNALQKKALDSAAPRIAEYPFDSERKRMTTLHQWNGTTESIPELSMIEKLIGAQKVAFTKGSVDGLLTICSHVWVDGSVKEMTAEWKSRIQTANANLASNGMRVLGVSYRLLNKNEELPVEVLEEAQVFIGMVGMIDPPRAEVKEAITRCKEAGIRPVMITGDHPLTALAIARQLGIGDGIHSLTGQEIDALSPEELRSRVMDTSVYARVSPEHKLKIVQALQNQGEIASMTGDGVNDAPALKKANIGVAMGITGTDVSKEAADLVLLDDNFATIIAAVEEGRTIYTNLRKFIKFSLGGNLAKVLVVLVGPLLGPSIPLLPLQLLWLNLLTDGLLGLGLGLEPSERGIMRRRPVSASESVLSPAVIKQVLWTGSMMGILALAISLYYYFNDQIHWQTMLFTTLAFSQIAQALAVRSGNDSLFKVGLLSNKPLLVISLVTFLLQILAVYAPPIAGFFKFVPLSGFDIALALLAGLIVFLMIEFEKLFLRRSEKNQS